MALKDECFECKAQAEHRHHVVPQVRGGTRTIPLCSSCHGKAHGVAAIMPALIREGIRKARARGVDWGKGPRGKHFYRIRKLYDQGYTPAEIARKLKCKRTSVTSAVSRYRKEKLK